MAVEALDPAGLQVLISQLTGVAEEMGAVLRRAAFSPNIKERADCSAALFTADGQLLVQAEHIPVHLGSMPASVAAAIGAGIDVGPGDQIVLNDPFAGGTHLNDITFVAPCFVGERIVGWAANRAHHADLGGMTAGSMPPEAIEIFQEGLRIPPVLLGPAVVAILLANSRHPRRAPGRPRRPGRRQRHRRRAPRGHRRRRRTAGRGARLRRTADASRPRGIGRRLLAGRGRDRLDRSPAPPAGVGEDPADADQDRRGRPVRLHRLRCPAAGQRQRRGGRHLQRRRLRAAQRHRSDHPGQRRGVAAGHGRRPRGQHRRRPGPGRSGGRQRRGLPTGRRRLPGRPRPSRAGTASAPPARAP